MPKEEIRSVVAIAWSTGLALGSPKKEATRCAAAVVARYSRVPQATIRIKAVLAASSISSVR